MSLRLSASDPYSLLFIQSAVQWSKLALVLLWCSYGAQFFVSRLSDGVLDVVTSEIGGCCMEAAGRVIVEVGLLEMLWSWGC